jgi:D-3-phosphoglycerate dehydrogenase
VTLAAKHELERRLPAQQRVLICDELAPEAWDVLVEAGYRPERCHGLQRAELLRSVQGATALIVRSATRVDRALIEAAGPGLAVIGRAGVGVDNIDCDAATEHGVVVMNSPAGNTTTTGELAIALLCALARHIPRADRSTRAGSWKKTGLMGTEIAKKTLGIVGLGRIGGAVARRALGLEMRVIAHDPYVVGPSPLPSVELMELAPLLAQSDFVSLHLPLTEQTRHLLSAERIAGMKPGARLINAARGGLVDETALAAALDSGRLAGAALDVLESEPPPPGHPLLGREDVIVTPHLGASSNEAQRNVATEIARQVVEFLAEGVARNAVNAPAVSAEMLREVGPYTRLAEQLGSFLVQTLAPPLRTLELSFSGEIAEKDTRPIGPALLVGVLKHVLAGPLNTVNAPSLAQAHGLRLGVVPDDEPHFLHSQIKVRALGRDQGSVVCGTVFGREPRLVRVDGTHLDLALAGPILITRHADQPGVVGLLGTILGRHAVNIRRVELGPSQAHDGLARAFLTLYDEPPPAVVAEIATLPPVREVRLVHL